MDKPHKKLDLWNTAMELAVTIYQVTDSFPREERYSLTDQIRRAVSSVPSNVAEGAGRQTKKEFINYLHMAQGSLSELDTHLELARRLGYLVQIIGQCSIEKWSGSTRCSVA
jgi:four helix bundle protein